VQTTVRRALALSALATVALIAAVIVLAERPWQPSSVADQASGVGIQEIRVRVFAWGLSPRVVRVSRGQTVRFVVSTDDLNHGFAINELGINLPLHPGVETTSRAVVVDVPDGVYPIHCSAFCGLGHASMKGKLAVGATATATSRQPWTASLLAIAIACAFVAVGGGSGLRRR
jgi:heme/copper-type cytochrome/quinol oxidase subunit 2